MLYINFEKPRGGISDEELFKLLDDGLNKLGTRKNVLVIPPDITRIHSYAGEVTQIINNLLEDSIKDIMPALGTHRPMTKDEIMAMYGDVPVSLFRQHDWRNYVVKIGEIPGSYISEVSGGRLDYDWPAMVNRRLLETGYDLILSVLGYY